MTLPLPPSLEERLERLEGLFRELSDAFQSLHTRLSVLEGTASEAETGLVAGEPEQPGLTPVLPGPGAVLNVLTQVGRSCLVLGGAFLVRSLTDSGMVPVAAGAALGLAYAIVWILLADRAAGRGQAPSGAFLGITAVVIAYPLIAETTTRFKVFAPAGAAAMLVALTALCLGVAWRGNLPVLAWAALFGAAGVAFALSLVTGAVEPFAAALLLIGLATAWLGYGHRHWHGLRWPAAAAANLMVLWAALRLAPGETPAPEYARPLFFFFLLAFALPFLYMGTFSIRMLARRRSVTSFEAAQTVAALAIGFGGAVLAARHVQDAYVALGASALGIAAGCYGVAFVFVERQQGHRRNFLFFATLALLLTLSGSALVAGGAALAFLWCALAVASAILAARFTRVTLAVHSAVYAAAAAWQSGLARASIDAFGASPARSWPPLTAAGLCAIAAATGCYVLLAWEKGQTSRARERFPRFALAIIVTFGGGSFAIDQLKGLVAGQPASLDSGAIAAVRTAVLAVLAFLLASARRRAALPELAWLAYGFLAIGAAKLLVEDLPGGRPATLFVAFAFYGTALLVAPRLLRRAPPLPLRNPGPAAAAGLEAPEPKGPAPGSLGQPPGA